MIKLVYVIVRRDGLSAETRAALSSAYNKVAEFNDQADRYDRQSEHARTAGLAEEHLAHLAPEVLEAVKQAANWLDVELNRRQRASGKLTGGEGSR